MKLKYVLPEFMYYNKNFWVYFLIFEKNGVPAFDDSNIKEIIKQLRNIKKSFGVLVNWQNITERGDIQLLEKKELAPPHILEKHKKFYEKYQDLYKQALAWRATQKNEPQMRFEEI